jgi:septal ring factor EnvC (AmiA/AmiB activator)
MKDFIRWSIILAGVFCLNGCVAYQIRDELKETNRQLIVINSQLDKMAVDLKQVNVSVTQANPKLEKSNHSLAVLENSMDPIRVSLRRIDDELAAFRQVIDKIDKYVPVDIKPNTPPPAPQPPTQEQTPQKK